MTKQKIIACIYAGDENDEYCSTCDGITMVVDEGTLPATECGGYEAPKEEPKPNKPAKPVVTPKKATKPDNTVVEKVTPVEKVVENEIPWKEPKANAAEPRETNENQPAGTFTPQQNDIAPYYTKDIHAESGITMEIKNGNGTSTWYKLAYGETRVVSGNLTPEEIVEAKKNLWDTVNREVDTQTAEVYEMLNKAK